MKNDQILSNEDYKKWINKDLNPEKAIWIEEEEKIKEEQVKYWEKEFKADKSIE